ncbi:hypothetical protein [Xanthomonas phage DES1]|nr:hypothetical protein [Xanthomonas phage DES1]
MPYVTIAIDDLTCKYVIIADNKIVKENIPTHQEALQWRNLILSQMEIV